MGLVLTKAGVLASLGLLLKLPASAALRTGLLLAPGGEFGFVAFGLATKFRVLAPKPAELLRTVTALSHGRVAHSSCGGVTSSDLGEMT